jgi:hypothetical protein
MRQLQLKPRLSGCSSELSIKHLPNAVLAAGLNVVQDKCIKIEHARFAGGLNLAGFNTGVISSKRNKSI